MRESEMYYETGNMFNKLKSNIYNNKNSENLDDVLANFDLDSMFCTVRFAIKGLSKYNKEDLRQLQDADIYVHPSIIDIIDRLDLEIRQVDRYNELLQEGIAALKENFINHNGYSDRFKIFSRLLIGYSNIAKYEEQVKEEHKKETLKKILQNKHNN